MQKQGADEYIKKSINNLGSVDEVKNRLTNQGYDEGEYVAYYNFLTKQVGDPNSNLFISEITLDICSSSLRLFFLELFISL